MGRQPGTPPGGGRRGLLGLLCGKSQPGSEPHCGRSCRCGTRTGRWLRLTSLAVPCASRSSQGSRTVARAGEGKAGGDWGQRPRQPPNTHGVSVCGRPCGQSIRAQVTGPPLCSRKPLSHETGTHRWSCGQAHQAQHGAKIRRWEDGRDRPGRCPQGLEGVSSGGHGRAPGAHRVAGGASPAGISAPGGRPVTI